MVDYGLGYCANSLELGCDCLGHIKCVSCCICMLKLHLHLLIVCTVWWYSCTRACVLRPAPCCRYFDGILSNSKGALLPCSGSFVLLLPALSQAHGT